MLPVGANAPVAGSYSSALDTDGAGYPPAIRTLPLSSRVAECQKRRRGHLARRRKCPVAGIV